MKSLRRGMPIFLSLSALLFGGLAVSVRAEEQCLKDAWEAYNKEQYKLAIRYADRCISDFGRLADKAQGQLDKEHTPEPPTGVVGDEERRRIFERGLLNDVATAYFIKGRSAEHLYEKGGPEAQTYKAMAQKAYEATCRYKHARTWAPKDPKRPEKDGAFWSPCEAASVRLPLD